MTRATLLLALVALIAATAPAGAQETAPPAGITPGPAAPEGMKAAAGATSGAPEAANDPSSDYPTVAIGDYIYACVKANGETQEAMGRCACSIDTIASALPYPDYESASTYLAISQISGEAGGLFRDSAPARAAIDRLRRAQAEAEILCF